jgi:hypothetical protein
MKQGQFGRDMTDEEYDALDEELTRATPEMTNIPGVFAAQRILRSSLDAVGQTISRPKTRPPMPPGKPPALPANRRARGAVPRRERGFKKTLSGFPGEDYPLYQQESAAQVFCPRRADRAEAVCFAVLGILPFINYHKARSH